MTMKPIYRLITAVLCAAFVVSGGRADDKQIQAQKQQRKVDYYYFEGLKDKQAGRHDVAYDHFRYCISLAMGWPSTPCNYANRSSRSTISGAP